MKVLVTGATGKVGCRLIPSLIESGYDVRALVRNSSNDMGKSLVDGGAEVLEGDILQPEGLSAAVDKIDAVVHLAAFFRSRDDEKIRTVNYVGTKNIADAMMKSNPKARFVFSSTSLAYSNNAGLALESDSLSPKRSYPASKVAAEQYLLDLHRRNNLDLRILRFPFVYGSGDPHLTEFLDIIEQLNWHPAQRLQMIHHYDIAQAVKLSLRIEEMNGEIYNVADDAPITLQEIMQITHKIVRTGDSTVPLANPWEGIMDTQKIRKMGFRPLFPSVYVAKELGAL